MRYLVDHIKAEIFNRKGELVQRNDDYKNIDFSKLSEDTYTIRYIDGCGVELCHDQYIKINQKGYLISSMSNRT